MLAVAGAVLAQIPPPPASGLELGPLNLRLYGLLIAIGAFLGLRLAVARYERVGGDPDVAEKAALLALGFGLLGARIGYVIPRLDRFLAAPQDILAIWQGGLTLFGGLTGGTIAVLVYCRMKQADIPAMADAMAPALPLAQAIGRWGNYFNQELYGRPTDLPWALEVEPAFRRPGFEQSPTFHPTFLYESLWNAVLVVVLLRIDRSGRLRRGSLFFCYLVGYGIGRAWIEALRIDTAERYLGLSRNNWIALLIIVIGIAGVVWWQRRAPASVAATPEASEPAEEQPGSPGSSSTDAGATSAGPTDAGPTDDGPMDAGATDAGPTDDGQEPTTDRA